MLGVWFRAEIVVQHWQDESDTDARAFIKSIPLPTPLSQHLKPSLWLLDSDQVRKQLIEKWLCCF